MSDTISDLKLAEAGRYGAGVLGGQARAEKINALFQECSAKTGENLNSFFKLVLETLIKTVGDNDAASAPDPKATFQLNNDPNKAPKPARRCC